jgi:hypothetical protein
MGMKNKLNHCSGFAEKEETTEADAFWEKSLKECLGRKAVSLVPPDNKDPDEAFLSGWWPSAI